MASVKDKNLGLNLGWQFGETPWNTGMDTNMVVLGSMANLTVKSATTKAEPFGNDGDVYFIPVGATGSNWSGKANHIAIYSGESTYSTTNVASVIGWVFIPVRQGWTFTVQDQGNRLVTWDALLGLTDTVNVSTFLTAASSYTATGNVTFSGSVKFSGTHSADTTELATLGYVNSAISSQDFSNYAKLDASQTFTGNVVFSKEVQGKLATQPSSLATLKNVTDAISGITLENTGEGFGIAEINTNGNLTFKKLRSTNSTVSIVDTPEGLNLTVAMPVSVQEFTDLLDAPSSYVGAANQYVKVNTDASGLEFSEGFDEKFISLSDVPSSYIGSEGKYLVVEGGKVAFKALPSFSTAFKFTELTDTPNLIATSAVGRHNLLRGSRTSPAKLEFTGDLLLPQKSTELPQMPSVLEAGKYLRVKGDNSGYELVSGTGGGGSDSSTTIKGDWTPPVTSIPALAKMQRAGATFFPMADDLIDEVVFTDNSVSTSENGEGGMAIASMPFDISGSTEDRFVVYMKYEGTETPDYVYYGAYSGLGAILNVGGEVAPIVFAPTVYYTPELGLAKVEESDPVTLYADWNPHADSIAHVMDFDKEVVEFWTSRNNGTMEFEQSFEDIEQLVYDNFGVVAIVDKDLVTHAALNTYFPVEEGESYRLVNSGKMSAAKTFDVSPSAVDVFASTQSVDLTPPENAANNAFILDVSDPVHIPELGKELENGDIVFFDGGSVPFRYIPKEFADDVDLSGYATEEWVEDKGYVTNEQIGTDVAPLDPDGLVPSENLPPSFSGAYDDLSGKPTLFSGDYNDLTNTPAQFSGAYDDLSGKPTLGTASALDIDTDADLAANSDSLIPSQKAVKAYVDGQVTLKPWEPEILFPRTVSTNGWPLNNFTILIEIETTDTAQTIFDASANYTDSLFRVTTIISTVNPSLHLSTGSGNTTSTDIIPFGVHKYLIVHQSDNTTQVYVDDIQRITGPAFNITSWSALAGIGASKTGSPRTPNPATKFKVLSGVYTDFETADSVVGANLIVEMLPQIVYPANATSNIFEITGTATPLQWDAIGGTVVDGDLVAFDSAGVPFVVDVTVPNYGTMAFVDDADSDDKTYARKNGAWVEVDKPQTIEVVTANKALTAADNNKILLISTDGITITLPSAIPNFTVDVVKMDEDFITVVATNGTDKYREDTTTITVAKDVTIFSSGVAGQEYVAIGAYEV